MSQSKVNGKLATLLYLLLIPLNSRFESEFKYQQIHRNFDDVYYLNYDLGDRQLNLSIDAATIQFPTPLTYPAVVFSGTFSCDTTANSGERVAKISTIIGNWQQQLNEFNSVVAARLLSATSDRQESFKSVFNDIKIIGLPVPSLAPIVEGC